ncbi:MAG: hypothetical protein HQL47_03645, partial [Gammaproteobacteria bacterium]|nr:hypothetical protein [Gammaproteobacteria bacterium]
SHLYTGAGSLSFSGAATTVNEKAQTISPVQLAMLADIWQRFGLDPASPMTVSASQISAGSLILNVSEIAGGHQVQRA